MPWPSHHALAGPRLDCNRPGKIVTFPMGGAHVLLERQIQRELALGGSARALSIAICAPVALWALPSFAGSDWRSAGHPMRSSLKNAYLLRGGGLGEGVRVANPPYPWMQSQTNGGVVGQCAAGLSAWEWPPSSVYRIARRNRGGEKRGGPSEAQEGTAWELRTRGSAVVATPALRFMRSRPPHS